MKHKVKLAGAVVLSLYRFIINYNHLFCLPVPTTNISIYTYYYYYVILCMQYCSIPTIN